MIRFLNLGTLFLLGDGLLGCLNKVGGVKTVSLHQLGGSSALAELILSVDKHKGCGSFGGKNAGNSLSESAGHIVLLSYHCATCLGDRGKDSLGVEGLDGGDVQNLGADAFSLKSLSCGESLPYEVAAGDEGHVASLVQIVNLDNLKRLVGAGERRYTGPSNWAAAMVAFLV